MDNGEINKILDDINDYKIMLQEIQSQCSILKDKLIDLLINEEDLNTAAEIANYLYWYPYLVLAGDIKKAWKEKTGKMFHPAEGRINTTCARCGKIYQRNVKSRRDAEDNWNSKHSFCSDCERIIEIEKQKRRQAYYLTEEGHKLRLEELRTMPYQDYLQTSEWQQKRKEAYRRAKGHCQLCNNTGPLDVHHRDYSRRGNELSADLIVLCRDCHAKFHGKEGVNTP